nr:MAG TPA: hypothetical protein [Caudoviricetes sp.]
MTDEKSFANPNFPVFLGSGVNTLSNNTVPVLFSLIIYWILYSQVMEYPKSSQRNSIIFPFIEYGHEESRTIPLFSSSSTVPRFT